MENKLKKTLKNTFIIVVTTVFGALLFYYVYKNWGDFANIHFVCVKYPIILITLGLINLIFQTFVLHVTVKYFDIELRWKERLGLTTWTLLGNYIFPFGGLGFRAAYLKKFHQFRYTYFITTLTALYLIQLLIYSIIGLAGLMFIFHSKGIIDWKILILMVIVSLICLFFIIFSPKLPVLKNKIYIRFSELINNFYQIKKNKKLMRELTLLSLASFVLDTLIFYFAYKSVGFNVNFFNVSIVSSLSVYALLIRITPASLGIYEGLVVYSTSMLGLTVASGLVIATITRFVSIIWALILAPFFGFILFRRETKS